MPKSRSAKKPKKPRKPSPDFPLTPHPRGKWCKKVAGKVWYFGTWSDPQGALREYLEIKDSLQAGIDPRKNQAGALTLGELWNNYLHNQKQRADVGEISQRTWQDRATEAKRMLKVLDRNLPVTAAE